MRKGFIQGKKVWPGKTGMGMCVGVCVCMCMLFCNIAANLFLSVQHVEYFRWVHVGMPQEGTGSVKGPRFGHATVWTLIIRY